MIHLFADLGDPGPGRQIAGVALFTLELPQLVVVRMEFPGNFEVLAKLDREVIVGPRRMRQLVSGQAGPIELTYLLNHTLICGLRTSIHGGSLRTQSRRLIYSVSTVAGISPQRERLLGLSSILNVPRQPGPTASGSRS